MARKKGGIKIVWLQWFLDSMNAWERMDESKYALPSPPSRHRPSDVPSSLSSKRPGVSVSPAHVTIPPSSSNPGGVVASVAEEFEEGDSGSDDGDLMHAHENEGDSTDLEGLARQMEIEMDVDSLGLVGVGADADADGDVEAVGDVGDEMGAINEDTWADANDEVAAAMAESDDDSSSSSESEGEGEEGEYDEEVDDGYEGTDIDRCIPPSRLRNNG
jgi:hypothetical protein